MSSVEYNFAWDYSIIVQRNFSRSDWILCYGRLLLPKGTSSFREQHNFPVGSPVLLDVSDVNIATYSVF